MSDVKTLQSGGKAVFIEKVKTSLSQKALDYVSSGDIRAKVVNEKFEDSPDNRAPRMTPDEQSQLIRKTERHPADGTNNDEVEAHDEMGKLRATDAEYVDAGEEEYDDDEDDVEDEIDVPAGSRPADRVTGITEDVEDFLRAASQAKKEGKKSFKFGEKTYPVTISRDDAEKIVKSDAESDGGPDDFEESLSEEALDEAFSVEQDLKDAVRKKFNIELEMADGDTVYLEWPSAKELLQKTSGLRIAWAATNRIKFMKFLDKVLS